MEYKKSYIWYAGYGSNLSKQRFLRYVLGGKPTYGQRANEGCSDKTLPLEDKAYKIPYQIYFALPDNKRSTSMWGPGRVSFIETNEASEFSYGRMWKINLEQYEEIKTQEGRSWYDKEILLGTQDHISIYTITNSKILDNKLAPSEAYLKTLMLGLKETFNMSAKQIASYLLEKEGLKDNFRFEDLEKLFYSLFPKN
jgi:hypothetical protein